MPERPKPDLDRTREALRQHDERVEDEADEAPDDAQPDDGDEQEEPDGG
jgi:hypothetical protein